MDIYDPIASVLNITPIGRVKIDWSLVEQTRVPMPSEVGFQKGGTPWNKGTKNARPYKSSWNKGLKCPRKQDSIEKQRATMKGSKRGPYNYNYKSAGAFPFLFRGKEYPSIAAARKDTGASFYTIKKLQQIL